MADQIGRSRHDQFRQGLCVADRHRAETDAGEHQQVVRIPQQVVL